MERVVPRGDGPDDADRLADDQRIPDLLVGWECLRLCEVGEHGQRQPELQSPRDLARRTHVSHEDLDELLLPASQRRMKIIQERSPVADGRGGPLGERLTCLPDGQVDVGLGAVGDAANDLLGGRVEHIQEARAAAGNPASADVVLVEHG